MISVTHQYGIQLELLAQEIMHVDTSQGVLGGIIDTKFIEEPCNAFVTICSLLSPFYINGDEKRRKKIDFLMTKYRRMMSCTPQQYEQLLSSAIIELRIFFKQIRAI